MSSHRSCFLLSWVIGGFALTACGGSRYASARPDSPVIARSVDRFASRSRSTADGQVYVADMYFTQVLIYSTGEHPKRVGRIRNSLEDAANMWIDAHGNLYIVDGYLPSVLVFPPGYLSPSQTYLAPCSPHCGAYSVAVDAQGVVYLGTNAPAIYEFLPNDPTPFQTITDSPFPYGMTMDRSGNLYVSNGGTDILRYAPGATNGVALGLQGLSQALGLTFDQNGDLVVANFDGTKTTAFFFKLGQTTAFYELHLFVGRSYQLAFDSAGTLYAPNYNLNEVSVSPSGSKRPSETITNLEYPDGVAVNPPLGAP